MLAHTPMSRGWWAKEARIQRATKTAGSTATQGQTQQRHAPRGAAVGFGGAADVTKLRTASEAASSSSLSLSRGSGAVARGGVVVTGKGRTGPAYTGT